MTPADSRPRRAMVASGGAGETRVKIILAAERLFGERGIEGVSFRQIRLAAGQSNNSAVHYHFRNRDSLIAAILEYRVGQMEPQRRAMVTKLYRDEQHTDLRSLLKVLLLPQVDIVDSAGKHPYAKFTSEYLTRFRATGIAHPGDSAETAPALAELMELFYTAMFAFDRDVALMRLNAVTLLVLNLITAWDSGLSFLRVRHELDLMLDEGLTMATAALQAPPGMSLRSRYPKG